MTPTAAALPVLATREELRERLLAVLRDHEGRLRPKELVRLVREGLGDVDDIDVREILLELIDRRQAKLTRDRFLTLE